ncbi:MAG: DnaJ domain-containing protein, partial [Myxococcales bacterium]
SADEVVWLQEEPENMGPWRFVHERLRTVIRPHLRHVSRAAAPSPATSPAAHAAAPVAPAAPRVHPAEKPAVRPSMPPPMIGAPGAPRPQNAPLAPAPTVAVPKPAPRKRVAPKAPPAPADAAPAPAANLPGPEFYVEVETICSLIEGFDYFQVLKLDKSASPRAIKEAYYRESRDHHPDRFAQLPDAELKEKINKIFKRVTEAYVVLRDDAKRAKYVADISGPEREKKLRFTEASEAEQKAEAKRQIEEQIGTTPKGRDAYRSAVKEMEARRYDGAIRHLKMALMYEPQNQKYKDKLAEAQAEFDKVRPKNDFKIR